MLQQSIPESRAAEAAQISAAVEAYLSRGGTIAKHAMGVGSPLQPDYNNRKRGVRVEKVRSIKELADKHCSTGAKGRQKHVSDCKARRDQHAPTVVAMSKEGKTVDQIAAATGLSVCTVTKIRLETGIAKPKGVRK